MLKSKILNLLLVLSSLFGYLEWGTDQKSFLFEAEAKIFSKIFSDPASVIHPFTILPLLGQILLIITLFQKKPGKLLTYLGLGGIGLLMSIILLVGILGMNIKVILSTFPFLIISYLVIRYHRKEKRNQINIANGQV